MRNFIVTTFFILSVIVLMDVASAQNIPMPPLPPIPEPPSPHMNHISKRSAQGPHDGGPHAGGQHGGPPPHSGLGGPGGPEAQGGESGNEMMMGSKNVAN